MKRSLSCLSCAAAFLIICGLSSAAEAVRVKNRDDRTHRLSVQTSGTQEQIVELAPGQIYFTYSPHVTLRLLSGEYPSHHMARYRDEYVIWPDGQMHIQKRRWPNHRSFGF